MSLVALANHMASKGRGGDSMLVHMTPDEVRSLQALAERHGGTLTINPETGQPEANFLKSILPAIAGFALGPAGFGLFGSALTAGAAVGGVTALATGSLSRGLMAGLGAYGGFGLGESLMGAGTGALAAGDIAAQQAAGTFPTLAEGATQAQVADYASQVNAVRDAALKKAGEAGIGERLSAGLGQVASNPVGYAKDAFKPLAAAATPILADEMVPTTTQMPSSVADTGNIRRFSYDPYTQNYEMLGVYPARGYAGYADGGIVALADGGTSVTPTAADELLDITKQAPAAATAPAPQTQAPVIPAYFQANQDVAQAYAQNAMGMTPEQFAQQHYALYGQKEGRTAPTGIEALTPAAPTQPSEQPGGIQALTPQQPVAQAPAVNPVAEFLSGVQQTTPDYTQLQSTLANKPQIAEAIQSIYALDPKHSLFTGSGGNLQPVINNLASEMDRIGSDAALKNFYKQQQNLVGFGGENWFGGQNMGNQDWAKLQREQMSYTPIAKDEDWIKMAQRTSGAGTADTIWRDPNSNLGIGVISNEEGTPDRLGYYDRDGRLLRTSIFTPSEVYRNAEEFGIDLSGAGELNTLLSKKGISIKPGEIYKGSDVGVDFSSIAKNEGLAEQASPGWLKRQIAHNNWQNQYARDAGFTIPDSVVASAQAKIVQQHEMAKRLLANGIQTNPDKSGRLTRTPEKAPVETSVAPPVGGGGAPTTPKKETATTLPTNPQTNAPPGTTNPYGNRNTPGDQTLNPDGTITVTPNIPGRPYGGFSGMEEVRNAYTAGGGSLGYTPYAPKTIEEFYNKYTNTGGSQQAYDYLMGNRAYPTVPYTPTGEIMRPYKEAVMGVPEDLSVKPLVFDPKTRTYKPNPAYKPLSYDSTGKRTVGASQNELAAAATQGDAAVQALVDAGSADYATIAAMLGISIADAQKRFPKKSAPAQQAPVIDNIANYTGYAAGGISGGLGALAAGGATYNLGSYSDGGRLLRGPGDGVSDSIPATIGKGQPARLADGEFVVPARIVSELGNGSTEAGARKLYAMMDRVQRARGKTTGKGKVAKDTNADKYLPA